MYRNSDKEHRYFLSKHFLCKSVIKSIFCTVWVCVAMWRCCNCFSYLGNDNNLVKMEAKNIALLS